MFHVSRDKRKFSIVNLVIVFSNVKFIVPHQKTDLLTENVLSSSVLTPRLPPSSSLGVSHQRLAGRRP
ncbi:hypothetical protein RRG08_044781 [Elysia crispata]|uniref:Uncharacterized protein n=1 Tax=Elysia crispata TaxID=231223 RepID=A0AAE1DNA8_9GAST|nr:hypothetical protein RRG08_044781 [Elysia crispata]